MLMSALARGGFIHTRMRIHFMTERTPGTEFLLGLRTGIDARQGVSSTTESLKFGASLPTD